jgi:hypothetical protein
MKGTLYCKIVWRGCEVMLMGVEGDDTREEKMK